MDLGKHFMRLERKRNMTASRENGLKSHTSFRDHDLLGKSQTDESEKIAESNPLFRESEHISEKNIPRR